MKQAQNARKQRARTSSRKGGSNKGSNPGNMRSDMKVRGNPKQLLEKYKNQAREAKQAGDRVLAEYYYQFADHYQRVCNELRLPSDNWADDDENTEYDIDGNSGGTDHDGADQAGDDQPGQDGSDDNQQSRDRGRRGRGGRRGNNRGGGHQNGGNGGDEQPRADIAAQEQPVEVHPELDFQDKPVAEDEEKPRRGRSAGPRRRAARPRKDEAGEGQASLDVAPPQDGEAA